MGYQALLFCPDDKTARTVAQILSELEFAVELCTEPFAAVKKLMAQHFDAIVVDCENEQNAALLFKSAHGSASNQTSLAVAVVEGQTGVAKAFRIGANLVLTKPINVEQAKGTLRVARGLLRKGDPSKTPAPAPSAAGKSGSAGSREPVNPVPQAMSPQVEIPRPMPPTPAAIAPSASSVARGHAPLTPPPSTHGGYPENDSKKADWEEDPLSFAANSAPATPISLVKNPPPYSDAKPARTMPGAITLPPIASPAHSSSSGSGTGSASAAAPARENQSAAPSLGLTSRLEGHGGQNPELAENISLPSGLAAAAPSFSFGGSIASADSSSGGIKKVLLAVAAIVIMAGLYFGWTQLQKKSEGADKKIAPAENTLTHVSESAVQPIAQPSTPSATPSSAPGGRTSPQPRTSALNETGKESKGSTESSDIYIGTSSNKPSAAASSRSAKPAEEVAEAPAPIVVKNNLATIKRPKVAPDVPAPGLVEMAPGSSGGSLSGILDEGNNAPKPILQTLNISQGVSQGLLIKKIQPTYPANALRMRVEGAVELQATIGKAGNIVSVKALSGDSQLARAAKDAVKQWKYKPYLLNGEPVEIQTQITVNFKLPK
jgi:protein TonB